MYSLTLLIMIAGASYELLKEFHSKVDKLDTNQPLDLYKIQVEELKEEFRKELLKAIGEYNSPTDCPVYSHVFGKK